MTAADLKTLRADCRFATVRGRSLGKLSAGLAPLPLVSIVITNHNYGAYVGQAIESVKRQDYPWLEVVVVDNASTDNSRAAIEAQIADDRRFSAIYSDRNDGPLGSAINGLKATRGQFIGFYDADDFLLENCISYHIQSHLAAPFEVAFTSANVLQVANDGSIISGGRCSVPRQPNSGSRGLRPPYQVPILPTISPEDYEALSNSSVTIPANEKGWLWYGSSAMLLRRRAVEMVLPHNPENSTIREDGFFLAADSFFAYNCHWLGGSLRIEIPLHAYRVHGQNQFNRSIHFRGVKREKSPVQKFLSRRFDEMVRDVVARHERLISQTSRERFWQIFDQACDRIEPPLKDKVSGDTFAVLAEAFPKLEVTFGARRTVFEFRRQIGLISLTRIIMTAYGARVPPRVTIAMALAGASKLFRYR